MPTASERNTAVRFLGTGSRETLRDCFTSHFRGTDHSNVKRNFVFEKESNGNGKAFGTLLFKTKKEKDKFFQSVPHCVTDLERGCSYEFDDGFKGLTVLHTADNTALDICAVHGLNGHAYETWTRARDVTSAQTNNLWKCCGNRTTQRTRNANTELSIMWLQDLLPRYLENCRLMTFGYASDIRDSDNNETIEDWSTQLLHAIHMNRSDCSIDRNRPIIFIAYSLGGLVLRQAMTFLNQDMFLQEGKYPRLHLPGCGIIFLGTPHRGSNLADFSPIASLLAEGLGYRMKDICERLQSEFSRQRFENEKSWNNQNIKLKCPFDCLAESLKTKTALGHRLIVNQESASFLGETATLLPGTDHHTICAFDRELEGPFSIICERIRNIKYRIDASRLGFEGFGFAKIPGHAPLRPPFIPLRPDIMEGKKLILPRSVYVETEDINELKTRWMVKDTKPIFVAGAGGIGKTEILVQLISRRAEKVFIFMVQTEEESLQKVFSRVASKLGPELLTHLPQYQQNSFTEEQLAIQWEQMGLEERAKSFKNWIEVETPGRMLFVVDDIDASHEEHEKTKHITENSWIPASQNLIYTTRDTLLAGYWNMKAFKMHPMNETDSVRLCNAILDDAIADNETVADSEALCQLVSILGRNPRAMVLAMNYITKRLSGSTVRSFLDRYCGNDDRLRRDFLGYEAPNVRSIMKTFESSLKRISCEISESNTRFILLVLLSILQSGPALSETHQFFATAYEVAFNQQHACLKHLKLFLLKDYDRGVLLEDFRSVSLVEEMTFEVHEPWAECALQLAGDIRDQLITDIVYIYESSSMREAVEYSVDYDRKLIRCLQACIGISKRFPLNSKVNDKLLRCQKHTSFGSVLTTKTKELLQTCKDFQSQEAIHYSTKNQIHTQHKDKIKGLCLQFFYMAQDSPGNSECLPELRQIGDILVALAPRVISSPTLLRQLNETQSLLSEMKATTIETVLSG